MAVAEFARIQFVATFPNSGEFGYAAHGQEFLPHPPTVALVMLCTTRASLGLRLRISTFSQTQPDVLKTLTLGLSKWIPVLSRNQKTQGATDETRIIRRAVFNETFHL